MTRTIKTSRLALALSGALLLAACGGGHDAPAEGHSGEAAHEAPQSSSAGLPDGRIAEGEQLANTKGKATGQSCIDCHGADGNAPLDPSYPKLGGQYRDYLAHAIQQYRDGKRGHALAALMSQQAADLSDQQIADLAAYFASRPGQLRDLHGVH